MALSVDQQTLLEKNNPSPHRPESGCEGSFSASTEGSIGLASSVIGRGQEWGVRDSGGS